MKLGFLDNDYAMNVRDFKFSFLVIKKEAVRERANVRQMVHWGVGKMQAFSKSQTVSLGNKKKQVTMKKADILENTHSQYIINNYSYFMLILI